MSEHTSPFSRMVQILVAIGLAMPVLAFPVDASATCWQEDWVKVTRFEVEETVDLATVLEVYISQKRQGTRFEVEETGDLATVLRDCIRQTGRPPASLSDLPRSSDWTKWWYVQRAESFEAGLVIGTGIMDEMWKLRGQGAHIEIWSKGFGCI